MALNFSDVASKKLADIERPPLPPIGTYRWAVTKLPESTISADGKWDILNFPVRAVEAMEDVEMDGYKGDVNNIIQSVRFMFNKEDEVEFEKTLDRVKTFLIKHLQCGDEADALNVAINNSVNQQFLAPIVWKQDKQDLDIFHANIGKTAPLD